MRGEGSTDADEIEASWVSPPRFGAIYERHGRTVFRFISAQVGSVAAEDLVAETFLTAFRIRSRYDISRSDALPWLFGIASNVLRHHRRSQARHLRLLARNASMTSVRSVDEGAQIIDQFVASQQVASMAWALLGLNPKQRQVLFLHAQAGLNCDEIATELGIPGGTVRSRLARARSHLREQLAISGQTETMDVVDRPFQGGRS